MRGAPRPRPPATRALVLLAAAAALAGCAQETAPPTRVHAGELLAALDDSFNRAAAAEYGRLFAPSALRSGATARVRRVLAHDRRLRQASTLLEFRRLGTTGIALVDIELHGAATAGGEPPAPMRTRHYLGFRLVEGEPRIVLYEDVDPEGPAHVDDGWTGSYRCAACNFLIGSAELAGWLVVPGPKRSSGCVEMVTFHRPGEDIRFTLSIHRNAERLGAQELLQRLIDAPNDFARPIQRHPIAQWRPPSFDTVPAGLQGAHCDLVLEGDRSHSLHLITRTTPPTSGYPEEICYLLTVRGSTAARREHRRDIETWLRSFRLLDEHRASDDVGYQSARMHSGRCELRDDGTYLNERYGFTCRGPRDWRPSLQAESGLFGVTYACPEGRGVVSVTAHESQPGTLAERRAGAHRQVLQQIERHGLAVVHDSAWATLTMPAGAGPAFVCEVESRPADRSSTLRRIDRILLFDDLWVLVAGKLLADDAVAAYRALAGSIER